MPRKCLFDNLILLLTITEAGSAMSQKSWEAIGASNRSRWPLIAGVGLALTVLALAIAISLLHLRRLVFNQIANRDGEALDAVAAVQFANDKANDDTVTSLDDPSEQIQLALKISDRLHNVLGVRLFSANGAFLTAFPPYITDASLPEADLTRLRNLHPVSHFVPQAQLGEQDVLAETNSAPVPLLMVNIPLREGGAERLSGIAQFLVHGAKIKQEYAQLDRNLVTQGALAFSASGLIVTSGLWIAFRRVQRANVLLADRTANLLQANRELALAAKTSAIGSVTSHLIHGLKNPLSGLRSFVQGQAQGQDPAQTTDWQLAIASTQRMQLLIDRVVRVLQEQQTSVEYEITLPELLEIITAKLRPIAEHAGVEFSSEITGGGSVSNREADLVMLILENLLQNAVDATPSGKRVQLRLTESEDGFSMQVEDQGPGLTQQAAQGLFMPCTSSKKGGSGIGLTISRQLAVHMGATLELKRNTPAGSCFELVLPKQNIISSSRARPPRAFKPLTVFLILIYCCCLNAMGKTGPLPNLVIIFTDDQGYADVGVFGAKGFSTPNLDRLASEGRIFRNCHVAQPICSASRAALLTGCYPNRIGISSDEMTLAELVKQRGYATAIFGKWHLGDSPQFLPLRHGFDHYFGLPYSNDMWPLHPDLVDLPPDDERRKRGFPDLMMYEDHRIVIPQVTHQDQNQLTTWYTEHAVRFIEQNQNRPFLLYLAHNMPHVPLHVSDKFRGKTKRGLYGDVIEEIDWSVGQVLDALKRTGLEQKTWVTFTSDNGPWLSYGDHAGSAYPLREGKGTQWEGGTREPCIMRWSGKIPAGTESWQMLMSIDLFPTIAKIIQVNLPRHPIDGLDVWPIISGKRGAHNPHSAYWFYYEVNELQAVVSADGAWKLQLPHTYRTLGGGPGGHDGRPVPYQQRKLARPELYDLRSDISETTDVAAQNPETVKHLETEAEKARQELGDALTKRTGRANREPGRVTSRDH